MLTKVGPIWLTLAAAGAVVGWRRSVAARDDTDLRLLVVLCVAAVALVVPFSVRPFQNAFYYIGAVGPLAVLAALALERLRETRPAWTLWIAVAALAASLGPSWRVRPDFLQSGSEWGEFAQGEFSGPAVNHCQGMPMAVLEIGGLVDRGGPRRAFALLECRPQWAMATRRVGRRDVDWRPRPAPLPRPHWLVVPRLVHYFLRGDEFRARRERDTAAALVGCVPAKGETPGGRAGRPYELFLCQ
jgi:hypothetical protein